MFKEDGSALPPPVEGIRGFPLYKYQRGAPGDPVYYPGRPEQSGRYFIKVRINDMNHSEICLKGGSSILLFEGEGPFVQLLSPNGGENLEPEKYHFITWNSNDYAVFTKLYLGKLDSYACLLFSNFWTKIDSIDGSITSHNWRVPLVSSEQGIYSFLE